MVPLPLPAARLPARGVAPAARLDAGAAAPDGVGLVLRTRFGDAALEHAVASGDPEHATHLLERSGLAILLDGGGGPLRRLLDDLPPDVLSRPHVALLAAEAALDMGDVPAADARLSLVGMAVEEQRTERLRALHAAVALHRARLHGDLPSALATLASVHMGETGDPDIDLLALLNRGISHIWLGDPPAAEAELQRALTFATHSGRDNVALQCLSNLGGVSASTSDLLEMSRRAEAALEFAAHRGWSHTSHCAFAYVLAGWGAYQRLDETASWYAALAVEVLEGQTDTTIELSALSLAAIVAFDSADDQYAVASSLRASWHRLGDQLMAPALVAYATPFEQRMALRVGEVGWAREVAERVRDLVGAGGEADLLHAVVLAHKGRTEAARRLLRPTLTGAVCSLTATTVLDAWLLEAVLADLAGDRHRAHDAVAAALSIAEPRQALRAFVTGGERVRELLARGAGRFGQYEKFAMRALTAAPPVRRGPSVMLTPRERDMLLELPSMHTIEEIADSLYLSVNTVKTHLRGVYRKLGVKNRREAITAARRCGLL